MKILNRLKKLIAVLTLLAFSCQNAVWASPDMPRVAARLNKPAEFRMDPLKIQIPAQWGEIQESFDNPSAASFVVHIQNAHGNYQAQKNIQNIISLLNAKYKVRCLFLEGANDKLDPSVFHFFDNNRLNLKAADLLMRQGEFTGAEMFLLARQGEKAAEQVEAYGIEDTDLYRRDFELFRKVIGEKEKTAEFLKAWSGELGRAESRIFSKELRSFVKEWRKWNAGSDGLLGYIRVLRQYGLKYVSLDLKDPRYQAEYGALLRILKLQELEGRLDDAKIAAEKKNLLEFLRDKIDKKSYRKLKRLAPGGMRKKAAAYPRFLFEKIMEQASPKGLDFKKYPHFVLFAEYLILESEIDSQKVFEEAESFSEKLFRVLTKTSEEKELLRLVLDSELLRKLLTLELSRKDYEKILSGKETLSPSAVKQRLARLIRSKENNSPAAHEAGMEALFSDAAHFYELALEREKHFIQKTMDGMREKAQTVAVVVTGGFHTDGIRNFLKEREIPHVSIMPRMAYAEQGQDLYLKAMMGETRLAGSSQIEKALRELPAASREKLVGPELLAADHALDLEAVRYVQAASMGTAGEAFFQSARLRSVNANQGRLNKTLLEALAIPGVSGEEEKIRKWIEAKLRAMGVKTIHPDSTGNLIAKIPATDKNLMNLLFSAHMDTDSKPPSEPYQISPDGKLNAPGLDNRAGIAAILELLEIIKENSIPHGDLWLVFTVKEETTGEGMKNLDLSPNILAKIQYAILLDEKPPLTEIEFSIRYELHALIPDLKQRLEQEATLFSKRVRFADAVSTQIKSLDADTLSKKGLNVFNVSPGVTDFHSVHEAVNVRYLADVTSWLARAIPIFGTSNITFRYYDRMTRQEQLDAKLTIRGWTTELDNADWDRPNMRTLIAFAGNAPIGYQAYSIAPDQTTVRASGLLVRGDKRRKGQHIGSKLRDAVLQRLQQEGFGQFHVSVEPNSESQKFHRKWIELLGDAVLLPVNHYRGDPDKISSIQVDIRKYRPLNQYLESAIASSLGRPEQTASRGLSEPALAGSLGTKSISQQGLAEFLRGKIAKEKKLLHELQQESPQPLGPDNISAEEPEEWKRQLQALRERPQIEQELGRLLDEKIKPAAVRREPGHRAEPALHVRTLEEVESARILRAVLKHQGNVRQAIREIGFASATVYKKLNSYGVMEEGKIQKPGFIKAKLGDVIPDIEKLNGTYDDAEKEEIFWALWVHEGDISKASKALGLTPTRGYARGIGKKLTAWGINPSAPAKDERWYQVREELPKILMAKKEQWGTILREESGPALADRTSMLRADLKNKPMDLDRVSYAMALYSEAARRALLGDSPIDPQILSYVGGEPKEKQMEAALLLLANRVTVRMLPSEGKTLSVGLAAFLKAISGLKTEVHDWSKLLSARDAQVEGAILHQLGMRVGAMIGKTPYEFALKGEVFPHLKSIPQANGLLGIQRMFRECDIVYGPYDQMIFLWMNDWVSVRNHRIHATEEPEDVIVEEGDTPLLDNLNGPLAFFKELYELGELPDIVYRLVYEYADEVIGQQKAGNIRYEMTSRKVRILKNRREAVLRALRTKLSAVQGALEFIDRLDFLDLLHAALEAQLVFQEKKQYLVKREPDGVSKGKIVLIDEYTGEINEDERLSRGLHTFLEIKHGLAIQKESSIELVMTAYEFYSRIRFFSTVMGALGNGDADRLKQLYNMDVKTMEPVHPNRRIDLELRYFMTEEKKFEFIATTAKQIYLLTGRPVLINARTPFGAEGIAEKIRQLGFLKNPDHLRVIDGQDEEANARDWNRMGDASSITVAAQLASRGQEIKLDPALYDKVMIEINGELVSVAGLFVLGSHRSMSERVEVQLKTRTARRGNPGAALIVDHIAGNRFLEEYVPDELAEFLAIPGVDVDSQENRETVIPLLFELARLRHLQVLALEQTTLGPMFKDLADAQFRYVAIARKLLEENEKLLPKKYFSAFVNAAYYAIARNNPGEFNAVLQDFNRRMIHWAQAASLGQLEQGADGASDRQALAVGLGQPEQAADEVLRFVTSAFQPGEPEYWPGELAEVAVRQLQLFLKTHGRVIGDERGPFADLTKALNVSRVYSLEEGVFTLVDVEMMRDPLDHQYIIYKGKEVIGYGTYSIHPEFKRAENFRLAILEQRGTGNGIEALKLVLRMIYRAYGPKGLERIYAPAFSEMEEGVWQDSLASKAPLFMVYAGFEPMLAVAGFDEMIPLLRQGELPARDKDILNEALMDVPFVLRLPAYPPQQAGSKGSSHGAVSQTQGASLGDEGVSRELSAVIDEWNERYRSNGGFVSIQEKEINLQTGTGGMEEFHALKKTARAVFGEALPISADSHIASEEELRTLLGYFEKEKLLLPGEEESLLEAYRFQNLVLRVAGKVLPGQGDQLSRLTAVHLQLFIEEWSREQALPPVTKKSLEARVHDFYRYHNRQAEMTFHAATRLILDLYKRVSPPEYRIREPLDEIFIVRERKGLRFSLEKGFVNEEIGHIDVKENVNPAEFFSKQPQAIFQAFEHAAARALPLSSGLEKAVIINRKVLEDGIANERQIMQSRWRRLRRQPILLPALNRSFGNILRSPNNIASVVWQMHRLGLLGLYLPVEFSKAGAVFADRGLYRFTVDMHTMIALNRLEGLADSAEPALEKARKVYRDFRHNPEEILRLRLALLFHDTGKALSGPPYQLHARSGADRVNSWLGQLGLAGKDDKERVEWVHWEVRNHALLNAEARRVAAYPAELSEKILSLHKVPGMEASRLRALYLISLADMLSLVPPLSLAEQSRIAAREAEQSPAPEPPGMMAPGSADAMHILPRAKLEYLDQLYDSVMGLMTYAGDDYPGTVAQVEKRKEEEALAFKETLREKLNVLLGKSEKYLDAYLESIPAGPLKPADIADIKGEILKRLDAGHFTAHFEEYARLQSVPYLRRLQPATILKQLFLYVHLRILKEHGHQVAITQDYPRFFRQREPYFHILIGTTHDRPGLLADIAGVLAANGVDIQGSEIDTAREGFGFNSFYGLVENEAADRNALRIQIGKDLDDVISGRKSMGALFREKGKPYHFEKKVKGLLDLEPEIVFEDKDSEISGRPASVFELRATDRVGLVHVVSKVLARRFGINIEKVDIDTAANGAKDAFFVNKDGRALSAGEKESLRAYLTELLKQDVIEGVVLEPQYEPQEDARSSDFWMNLFSSQNTRLVPELQGLFNGGHSWNTAAGLAVKPVILRHQNLAREDMWILPQGRFGGREDVPIISVIYQAWNDVLTKYSKGAFPQLQGVVDRLPMQVHGSTALSMRRSLDAKGQGAIDWNHVRDVDVKLYAPIIIGDHIGLKSRLTPILKKRLEGYGLKVELGPKDRRGLQQIHVTEKGEYGNKVHPIHIYIIDLFPDFLTRPIFAQEDEKKAEGEGGWTPFFPYYPAGSLDEFLKREALEREGIAWEQVVSRHVEYYKDIFSKLEEKVFPEKAEKKPSSETPWYPHKAFKWYAFLARLRGAFDLEKELLEDYASFDKGSYEPDEAMATELSYLIRTKYHDHFSPEKIGEENLRQSIGHAVRVEYAETLNPGDDFNGIVSPKDTGEEVVLLEPVSTDWVGQALLLIEKTLRDTDRRDLLEALRKFFPVQPRNVRYAVGIDSPQIITVDKGTFLLIPEEWSLVFDSRYSEFAHEKNPALDAPAAKEALAALLAAQIASTAAKQLIANAASLGQLEQGADGASGRQALAGSLGTSREEVLKAAIKIHAMDEAAFAGEFALIKAAESIRNLSRRVPAGLPPQAAVVLREALRGNFNLKVISHLKEKLQAGRIVNLVAKDEIYKNYIGEDTGLEHLAWADNDGRIILLGKFYEYLENLKLKDAPQAEKLRAALLARLSVTDILETSLRDQNIQLTPAIQKVIEKIARLFEKKLAGKSETGPAETALLDFSKGWIHLNRFDRQAEARRSERFARSSPSRPEKVMDALLSDLQAVAEGYYENRKYYQQAGRETTRIRRMREKFHGDFGRIRTRFKAENFNHLSARAMLGIERLNDSEILEWKIKKYTERYEEILKRISEYIGDEKKHGRIERLNREARDLLSRLVLMEMRALRFDEIMEKTDVRPGSDYYGLFFERLRVLRYHMRAFRRELMWLRAREAGREEVTRYVSERAEAGDDIGNYLLSPEFFTGAEEEGTRRPEFLTAAVGEVRGGGKDIRDTIQTLLEGGAIEYKRVGYKQRAIHYKETIDRLIRPYWGAEGFKAFAVERLKREGIQFTRPFDGIGVDDMVHVFTSGKIYEEQLAVALLGEIEAFLLSAVQEAEKKEEIQANFDENAGADILQVGAEQVTARYKHIFDLLRSYNHTLASYADANVAAYEMLGYLDDTLDRLKALRRREMKDLPALEHAADVARRTIRVNLAHVMRWALRGVKPSRRIVIDEIRAARVAMMFGDVKKFERTVQWARFHIENYIDENIRISKYTALKAMHVRDKIRRPVEMLLKGARIRNASRELETMRERFFPARFEGPGYSRARERIRKVLERLGRLDGRTVLFARDRPANNRARQRYIEILVELEMLMFDVIYKHVPDEDFRETENALRREIASKILQGKKMDEVTFTRETLRDIRNRTGVREPAAQSLGGLTGTETPDLNDAKTGRELFEGLQIYNIVFQHPEPLRVLEELLGKNGLGARDRYVAEEMVRRLAGTDRGQMKYSLALAGMASDHLFDDISKHTGQDLIGILQGLGKIPAVPSESGSSLGQEPVSEQRNPFVLINDPLDIQTHFGETETVDQIILISDNSGTLTEDDLVPLYGGLLEGLQTFMRTPNNVLIINSGDPLANVLDKSQRPLIDSLADADQRSRYFVTTDGGSKEIHFKPDGGREVKPLVEDWSPDVGVTFAKFLTERFYDQLKTRSGRLAELFGKTTDEEIEEARRDALERLAEIERHKAWGGQGAEGKRPAVYRFDVLPDAFIEKHENNLGDVFIYDVGPKQTLRIVQSAPHVYTPSFYQKIAVDTQAFFRATYPDLRTAFGTASDYDGFVDLTRITKAEVVEKIVRERVFPKLDAGKKTLIFMIGDGSNDIPTFKLLFSDQPNTIVIPVFLNQNAIYAALLPQNTRVGKNTLEGALEVIRYINTIRGKIARLTQPLSLSKWQQAASLGSESRAAEFMLKVALPHDQGGITEGVLFIKDEKVLRWAMKELGLLDAPRQGVAKAFQAYNKGKLDQAIFERFNIQDGNSPDGGASLVLFPGVLDVENSGDPEELAEAFTGSLEVEDQVILVRRENSTVLDSLIRSAARHGIRVRTVRDPLVSVSAIDEMVKTMNKLPIIISSVGERRDLEINFKGRKFKFNDKELQGRVDKVKVIGLLRKIADYPDKFNLIGLTAKDGYWEIGGAFADFIEKLYNETRAEELQDRAA